MRNAFGYAAAACAAAMSVMFTGGAAAQATSTVSGHAFPVKPMRVIVPFPPGGATDIQGRFIAQKLNESFGQQVVVDNRPGANGTLGLDIGAKAPPDGHTLVIGQAGNLAISRSCAARIL